MSRCFQPAPVPLEPRMAKAINVGGLQPELSSALEQGVACFEDLDGFVDMFDDVIQGDDIEQIALALEIFDAALVNIQV